MTDIENNIQKILAKLNIEALNSMQLEASVAINKCDEIILLSPTGSGKTLAYLLPLLNKINPDNDKVQALIIVPTRELAIQIEQVARDMGTGLKINEVYGGRHISKDKIILKHNPSILIGTPGRIADHLRNETFDTSSIKTIILDEFDKSLEIGFEDEMAEIFSFLPNIESKILTSATRGIKIPFFVMLKNPEIVDYLDDGIPQLKIKIFESPQKDKLETLVSALYHLGNQSGIVFCNYKDSIQRISEYLSNNNIEHGCFYGGLEQKDRERALIKFRNGTYNILLSTDLAARGLDIPEIKFIIHYHLPAHRHEFVHRNGRTARMHEDGTAYILKWKDEPLPSWVDPAPVENITKSPPLNKSKWATLFISGGRTDKISKGDIVGLLIHKGKLSSNEIGNIELKHDCAFVAIDKTKINYIINDLNNSKLKNKKVRLYMI
jgi:superfamily II DNA/RNA helicase